MGCWKFDLLEPQGRAASSFQPAHSLFLCFAATGTLTLATTAHAEDAVLRVSFGGKTLDFTAADLGEPPHQVIMAMDWYEKTTHQYSRVPVREVLARAGASFGEKLRGQSLRRVPLLGREQQRGCLRLGGIRRDL